MFVHKENYYKEVVKLLPNGCSLMFESYTDIDMYIEGLSSSGIIYSLLNNSPSVYIYELAGTTFGKVVKDDVKYHFNYIPYEFKNYTVEHKIPILPNDFPPISRIDAISAKMYDINSYLYDNVILLSYRPDVFAHAINFAMDKSYSIDIHEFHTKNINKVYTNLINAYECLSDNDLFKLSKLETYNETIIRYCNVKGYELDLHEDVQKIFKIEINNNHRM